MNRQEGCPFGRSIGADVFFPFGLSQVHFHETLAGGQKIKCGSLLDLFSMSRSHSNEYGGGEG